jgi:hypothetical protein
VLNKYSMLDEVTPIQFNLIQNYPNPFNDRTIIKYCVAYKTRVQLTVINSDGDVIEKLIDEEKKAGTYEVEFDTCANHSDLVRNLANGNYFYRLDAGDYSSERKMVLQK